MLKKREYARIGETAYTGSTESGLRLTVVPKPEFKRSMAFLAVNYGSVDRDFRLGGRLYSTPLGTAHFLEHRLFEVEGEDNALTTMSKRGADANAFTSADMTAYHFQCTDSFFENLELLLKFVSTPYFTAEGVERERSIITREIKMLEDDPEDVMYYALMRCLYEHSPLRESAAGTAESIGDITAETLFDVHRAFYIPENMYLTVVGPQDPKRVLETAERLTDSAYRELPKREYGQAEGPLPAEVSASTQMDVGAPMFLAGAKGRAGLSGRESVKFELTATLALSSLLGSATPLYRELYDAGHINETFGYDLENAGGYSTLSFGGETQKPEYVCMRVLETAADLAAGGIDPAFFARRKRTAWGSALRALGSFENVCYNIAAGGFSGYDYLDTVDVIDSVTEEDVRAFLAEYLTLDRCAISVVTPANK